MCKPMSPQQYNSGGPTNHILGPLKWYGTFVNTDQHSARREPFTLAARLTCITEDVREKRLSPVSTLSASDC